MNEPRLLTSGLTGRHYIVTKYTDLGDGQIRSDTKYDVTDEVEAIVNEHEKELRAGVDALLTAVRQVVDAWDHGDLAEAVNSARITADEVRKNIGEEG